MDKSPSRITEVSATQAKQSFGDLLTAAAGHPVAIRKHDRIQTILAPPSFFAADRAAQVTLALRRLARAEQSLVERDHLIKHQRIALRLLTAKAAERRRLVERARKMVDTWRAQGLCSRDYIERWNAILGLPTRELALAIVSDADGWGTALRQNSPWSEPSSDARQLFAAFAKARELRGHTD